MLLLIGNSKPCITVFAKDVVRIFQNYSRGEEICTVIGYNLFRHSDMWPEFLLLRLLLDRLFYQVSA